MKLACVVHRFGADIAGGSEGHCRLVSERRRAREEGYKFAVVRGSNQVQRVVLSWKRLSMTALRPPDSASSIQSWT